jgi:hypothetical protein
MQTRAPMKNDRALISLHFLRVDLTERLFMFLTCIM